jgi:hypothetical protein
MRTVLVGTRGAQRLFSKATHQTLFCEATRRNVEIIFRRGCGLKCGEPGPASERLYASELFESVKFQEELAR